MMSQTQTASHKMAGITAMFLPFKSQCLTNRACGASSLGLPFDWFNSVWIFLATVFLYFIFVKQKKKLNDCWWEEQAVSNKENILTKIKWVMGTKNNIMAFQQMCLHQGKNISVTDDNTVLVLASFSWWRHVYQNASFCLFVSIHDMSSIDEYIFLVHYLL